MLQRLRRPRPDQNYRSFCTLLKYSSFRPVTEANSPITPEIHCLKALRHMPVVVSAAHGGWVRVPPPKRPKNARATQKKALYGPLSYFSCRPVDAGERSKVLKQPCHPFDPPEDPRPHRKRVVSAPQRIPEDYDEDDEDDEGEEQPAGYDYEREATPVRPPPRSRPNPPHQSKPRAVSSQLQSAIFQPRQSQPHRNANVDRAYSSNTIAMSSSWSNATKPLDLG